MGSHRSYSFLRGDSITAEIWTPFVRRCSPLRVKLMCLCPPLLDLRETPRIPTPNQMDMKLTFVIWAKKSKAMRVVLMRPLTNLTKVKFFESKTMNSEVEIEEADKNLRETTKMASDNEQKLDELTRKLGVQEDELKRSTERAELAEGKLKNVEDELEAIGDNMKQL